LKDPERSVREAAATALGEIKDPRAIPALVEALKDWELNVQEAAAKALSVFGEQVLPDVLPLLKAEDWHARQGAVMALGYSGLEQATQILLPIFRNDPERNVRNAAMEALKRLQAASVEAFIAMLYDPDTETRQKAISALGDMRDRRAEEPLLSLLWDEDQAIRMAAFGALQRLGVFDPIALSTPPRTSHLYVMVCSPRDLPPDEWGEIAHQALMELGEQAPALQWVHATVLSDFSRLHESFYRFEPSERAFQGLVKAFQEWILSEGGTIAEWEARFFHRELADLPDLEEVDAILFYYQP
ncbi:MAG: HEAT repeat domain-containing protein, partial [Chloroflexi bacterium]|nr:HEAT repeat domain-containing protein [Chloroflexota bacterium]